LALSRLPPLLTAVPPVRSDCRLRITPVALCRRHEIDANLTPFVNSKDEPSPLLHAHPTLGDQFKGNFIPLRCHQRFSGVEGDGGFFGRRLFEFSRLVRLSPFCFLHEPVLSMFDASRLPQAVTLSMTNFPVPCRRAFHREAKFYDIAPLACGLPEASPKTGNAKKGERP
jgi:hypothetical protein